MNIEGFSTILRTIDVSNVFIYVGDAVRFDSLHGSIDGRGITCRTISGSTHSPASFATIATGKYAPTHGVETFSDVISEPDHTMFSLPDHQTGFVNSIGLLEGGEDNDDPIYQVLGRQAGLQGLDDVTLPFCVLERGPGGHAPYDSSVSTAPEYFASKRSVETMQHDYRRKVSRDAEVFAERIKTLSRINALEDTLVIFTSDHGELLGEGGLLEHNEPMRPNLVYTPTVFIHPSLPNQRLNGAIHHADFLPTIRSILDYKPVRTDGADLCSSVPAGPRPSSFKNDLFPASLPLAGKLAYRGAWDKAGGYVFVQSSITDRLLVLGAKVIRSDKKSFYRRNMIPAFRSYISSGAKFGKPGFGRQEAKSVAMGPQLPQTEKNSEELSERAHQRLEDLGYR